MFIPSSETLTFLIAVHTLNTSHWPSQTELFFSVCAIVWQKANRRERLENIQIQLDQKIFPSLPHKRILYWPDLFLSLSHSLSLHTHTYPPAHTQSLCVGPNVRVRERERERKRVWISIPHFFFSFVSLFSKQARFKFHQLCSFFLFADFSLFCRSLKFFTFLNFIKKKEFLYLTEISRKVLFSFDVRWFVKTKQSSNVEEMIFGHTDWNEPEFASKDTHV